jgi:hypothetical protein
MPQKSISFEDYSCRHDYEQKVRRRYLAAKWEFIESFYAYCQIGGCGLRGRDELDMFIADVERSFETLDAIHIIAD